VAGKAAKTARRILRLREDHRSAITAHLGRVAGNSHRVLESLHDRLIVSVTDVPAITGTTDAGADTSILSVLGFVRLTAPGVSI
jgi:hypothetical protein